MENIFGLEIKINDIKRKCINIITHCTLGAEYTTSLGNGINSCEASGFAYEILKKCIGIEEKEIEKLVHKRAKDLIKDYDLDEEDYEYI